ncbi:hypothetical protein HAX54_048217 [Datura stramonium]|uniref:Uncharacterized protein n=1 Tax=Datura stramonium TaxID=4076 RepID=A0ABS8SUZ8_DATST|nr:hypothetical protein [Datura stramonium]
MRIIQNSKELQYLNKLRSRLAWRKVVRVEGSWHCGVELARGEHCRDDPGKPSLGPECRGVVSGTCKRAHRVPGGRELRQLGRVAVYEGVHRVGREDVTPSEWGILWLRCRMDQMSIERLRKRLWRGTPVSPSVVRCRPGQCRACHVPRN